MPPQWPIRGALLCHVACMAAAVTSGSSASASLDQLAASSGLQASCQQAIRKLSAELDGGSSRLGAMFTITQAAVATGRIMEALQLLNLGYMMGMAQKVKAKDAVAMYPFVSPGSPDSCAYIRDFHYCRIDLASVFVRFGVCVPSACGAADVAILINNTYHYHDMTQGLFGSGNDRWLTPLLHLEGSTRCGPRAYGFTPTTATYVMAALTAALVALAALATGVDRVRHWRNSQAKERGDGGEKDAVQHDGAALRWYERDGLFMESVLCWSVFKNVRALTAEQRGGPFDSLDGIRALSATWIVFSHMYIFGAVNLGYTNVYNLLEARGHRGLVGTYAGQAIPGGYFAVDTFLFMGAFLAVYLMMKALQQSKVRRSGFTFISSVLSSPRMYVLRYLRLTPAYAYILFMYWHVLRVADKGPFFTAVFEPEYAACEQSWYRNLLYISNFVKYKKGTTIQLCYGVTWYLALDFQLFLLTPLVAGLAHWRHTWALLLLAFGMVASVAWAYVESVRQQWTLDTMDDTTYFSTYYLLPWFRATPYLVGMGLAIVWHAYLHPQRTVGQRQEPDKILSSRSVSREPSHMRSCLESFVSKLFGRGRRREWAGPALLYTSVLLFGILILGGRGTNANVDHPWTRDRTNVYIALSRPAWSIALACFALSLFSGYGGGIKTMLESRPLAIVSRLTYCVYLVHVGVIQWLFAMMGPMHWSVIWCIVVYLGVLCTVLLLSTLVHLLVESPVCALIKLLTSKDGQRASRSCRSDGVDMDKSEKLSGTERDRSVKLCVTLPMDCESKCGEVCSANV